AVTVERHRPSPPHRPRAPYRIYTSDETGDLILTYFNARKDYLENLLPIGERRYVSGTVTVYDGMPQMVHPDRVVDEPGFARRASGRTGLSVARGAHPQSAAQVGRRGARARARPAGVAGRGLGRARILSELRRSLAYLAPAGGAGRRRPRGSRLDAACL